MQSSILACEIDDEPDCEIGICDLFSSIFKDEDSLDGEYESTATNSTSAKRFAIEPRGKELLVKLTLGDGTQIIHYLQPYPSIEGLYKGVNRQAVTESAFDFAGSKCESREILDPLLTNLNLKEFVTEHIVKVCLQYCYHKP